MSKLITMIVAISSFSLGYVTSTLSSTDSEHPTSPANHQAEHSTSSNQGFINQLTQNMDQVNPSNMVKLSQQNQDKAIEILNNLPEKQINTYLEQAFPDQELGGIRNKRQFAERLIEEMSQDKDESNTLSGKIFMSTNPMTPNSSTPLNEVHAQQFIYAHFDTYGKVPPNTQVFVKWINQETQEVVLFSPKYIVENSQQNWVSAVPTNGWKPGKYDVKFYQMSDSLTPIAQSSYTIQSVLQ